MSFLEFLQSDEAPDPEPLSKSAPTTTLTKTFSSPRNLVITEKDEEEQSGSMSFLEFLQATVDEQEEPSTKRNSKSKFVQLKSDNKTTRSHSSSGKVKRLLSVFENKQPTDGGSTAQRTFSWQRKSQNIDLVSGASNGVDIGNAINNQEEKKRSSRLSVFFQKAELKKTPSDADTSSLSVTSLVMDIGRKNRDMSKIIINGSTVDSVREFFTNGSDELAFDSSVPGSLPVENEKLLALKSLLQDKKHGVPLLIKFAKSEYSQENVEAYLAVTDVLAKAHKSSLTQIAKNAREIYDKYLKPGSFTEVNVANWVRENYEKALPVDDSQVTDDSPVKAMQQFQVYLLVNIVDTFTRLIKKEEYKNYCITFNKPYTVV
jgi:hypothetical protein